MAELDPSRYTVAWIASLEIEAAAYAKAVLGEIFPRIIAAAQPQSGPVFRGPISGQNVIAGMTTSGGTVNLQFP
jgi:hypothetical protein